MPFRNQFFTSVDVCCDTFSLVRHFVRVTCADELMDVNPRCVATGFPMHGCALMVLCKRTTAQEDAQKVFDAISTFSDSDNHIMSWINSWHGWKALDKLIDILSGPFVFGAVLLFRIGWEGVKEQQAEERKMFQTLQLKKVNCVG